MSAVMRRDPCISDLAFDEWLSGECSLEARNQLEAHLTSCVRCRLRCDSLVQQRALFLERAPDWQRFVAARATAREQRPSSRRHDQRSYRVPAAGIALAASLAVAFLTLSERAPSTRAKGGPRIGAYVKRKESVVRAQAGYRVQPGDRLRFVYSSSSPTYFALLHRDERSATVYYPLAAHGEWVSAGRDVALDFSIELDDLPGVEQLNGVFCTKPVLLEPLRAELAKSGSLPKLPDCTVDVLELSKTEARE